MSDSHLQYTELKSEIDTLTEKLFNLHSSHISCKKGCDLCCMDYKVFPIEFEAIKQAIKLDNIDTKESINGSCVFLKNHTCQIYENRPIICRTHGLPLLFMNDDQWELSACELNFTEFDDDGFNEKNTFPQDKFNSKLFMLNKAFIAENKLSYSEFDLIPLKKLIQKD